MDNKYSIYNVAKLLSEKTDKNTSETEFFLRELTLLFNEGITNNNFVKIKGIGTFKVALVKERESVHVNTGERIVIPPHYKLSYIPEKKLRDLINKPFALFEAIETQEDDNGVMTFSVAEQEAESEMDTSVEENDSLANDDQLDVVEYKDEVEKTELQEGMNKEEIEEIVYAAPPIPSLKKEFNEPMQEEMSVQPPPPLPPAPSQKKLVKEKKSTSKTSSTKTLYAIFFFLLFILIGGGIWYFFFYEKSMSAYYEERLSNRISGENSAIISEQLTEDINAATDTTISIQPEVNTKDSVITVADRPTSAPVSQPTATSTPPATSRPQSTSTSQTNTSSTSNNVLASVRIEPGQRLTLIAEKYYGHKVFWVYIYEYNKSKIGPNPNLVKTGMEILVPAKALYGIDAQSAASIDKATSIQTQIMEGL